MSGSLKEYKCGICGGIGKYRESDGFGGKWDEPCYQCRGKGTVLVLIGEFGEDTKTDSDTRFSLIELE